MAVRGLPELIYEMVGPTSIEDLERLRDVSRGWAKEIQHLRVLRLGDYGEATLSEKNLQIIHQMTPNLTTLELRGTRYQGYKGHPPEIAFPPFASLRVLELQYLTSCLCLSLVVSAPQLESLVGKDCQSMKDKDLVKLSAGLGHMASLKLWFCRWITDDGIRSLENMKSLRVLSLMHCPRVTGIGFNWPDRKLEVLNVSSRNYHTFDDFIACEDDDGFMDDERDVECCYPMLESHPVSRITVEGLAVMRRLAPKHLKVDSDRELS